MAGHSHWKSIKNKKGAADAKRGKIFSKFAKLITVAAKNGGGNMADNLRLRYAVDRAKAESMPKDSIERAIKKGTGALQGEELAELVYEGIVAGGISLIIEALTDNRARTGGEVRNMLEKSGGSLGKSNSVLWKFDRKGVLSVAPADFSEEEIFEAAIEAGADNVEADESGFTVTTKVDDFEAVRAKLQTLIEKKRARPDKKWGDADDDRPYFLRNELIYAPQSTIPLEGDRAKQMLSLITDLEDHEDVQNVYCDFDIPADVLQELESS